MGRGMESCRLRSEKPGPLNQKVRSQVDPDHETSQSRAPRNRVVVVREHC